VTATVAFLNQKGGVGKTTVTLGLASAAQAAGDRVLVIDLDPQANASWILGVDPSVAEVTTADLLAASKGSGPGKAGKAVVGTGWGPAVDLVPSSGRLLEHEGGHAQDTAARLRKALAHIRDDYELVLIDCAPSLGRVTTTGLAASDLAVMVVEPSALSLRGIEAVADTIESVWEKLNPTLDLAGVIGNRVPGVSAVADRRLEELGRIVGRRSIWLPVVPPRVIVNQAAAERAPTHGFGARAHDVTDAFDQLYRKLKRVARKRAAGPSA
jgi:cellulose biosynthesis protein BcsQ